MSSRFTKISPRQTGQPRFPPADDLVPANGPVVAYRLTPEEITARYGPPVPRVETRRQKLSRENLTELLRTKTVGQVAERYCVSQKLVFELVDKYELELDDKNRLVPGGDDEMAHGDKLRRARTALPKEEFEKLFKQNLSDQEIADAKGVAYHHVVRLKKEYGFTGIIGRGGRNQFKKKETDNMSICDNVTPVQESEAEGCTEIMEDTQEPEAVVMFENPGVGSYSEGENLEPEAIALFSSEGEIQVEQVTDQGERKMTISAAIEHQANMAKEADCIEGVLQYLSEQDFELTPGVLALLKGYQEDCNSDLERVTKAFETVEITI